MWIVIYFNPTFDFTFSWLICCCFFKEVYYVLVNDYYIVIICLRLSIIFCLSCGDTYLSLDISWSFSFVTVSELFCCDFFYFSFLYNFNLSSSWISCLSSGDKDLSFFKCFFTILFHNCFWIILWRVFWNFFDFISNFITSQINSFSCCFLIDSFWIIF